ERDVLLGRVLRLPEIPANVNPFEEAGRFDFRYVIRDPIGWRRGPFARVAFTDGVVDLLDLREERVVVDGKGVLRAPERELTGRSQQLMCLAVADRRVDPVPCGRGVDKVELVALALPDLERRDMDFGRHPGQVGARKLG